jgi:hypothetical protein
VILRAIIEGHLVCSYRNYKKTRKPIRWHMAKHSLPSTRCTPGNGSRGVQMTKRKESQAAGHPQAYWLNNLQEEE